MLENLQTSFLLLVVGMGGVILSLYFLSVVIWLFKKVDAYLENRTQKTAHTHSNDKLDLSPLENSKREENIELEEVAAIAAAVVKTFFSGQIRIKKVRFLSETPTNSWASLGRNNIMSSHKIERSSK